MPTSDSAQTRGRTAAGGFTPIGLQTQVAYLKGAGPAVAAKLALLDIHKVGDLLFHLPIRYEDRRSFIPISRLSGGTEALVRGQIVGSEQRFSPRRNLRVAIDDGGASLVLRFFHYNEAQRAALSDGRWVAAYGPVRATGQGFEIVHPEYRVADAEQALGAESALTPIYPTSTGLTQTRLRGLIRLALDIAASDPSFNRALPDLKGPSTLDALRALHAPRQQAPALDTLGDPAVARLIKEELLAHQLCMRLLRKQSAARRAPRFDSMADALSGLESTLAFRLTAAQRRVAGEIGADLASARPMLRLLQGDVGSGKTLVAAAAMFACARAGWQAVMMVPTELLAEQHLRNLSALFAPQGIEVGLLSGRLRKSEKDAALLRAAEARTQLWIGTHALFQTEARFAKLGLVVVDEQHRFGVGQRLALRDKGPAGLTPHQLVMSATPIPRTLAQTLYADLDVSVIDELPPGRTPVQTVALSAERRAEVLARIGEVCARGRQAYWVCTLIEENDTLEAEAAEATYRRLREELPALQVGLVHGRMKAVDKDAQMRAFAEGRVQLLVATTVIEVGVDVPNASIMIIDNAERLGLSQLHQLRGRVGRGAAASQCVLLYQPPLSLLARARLGAMRETQDGFAIAQRDLELRGPGELLGRRQAGVVGLKIADPLRDAACVMPLQQLADLWIAREDGAVPLLIERWVGDAQRYAQA